jgi:transcriptional regulator with XRE-family HTH domain
VITIMEVSPLIKSRMKILIAEKELRDKHKIEFREIASVLKITPQQFSAWVNDRGWPRLDKAYRLARYLECKVDDLYEYEEEEQK